MDKEELVALLKQGVPEWNSWRTKELDRIRSSEEKWWRWTSVDLRGVDLCRTNLAGANLHDVDLSEANLRETVLAHADLSIAQLDRANLFRADLRSATLLGAKVRKANLIEARLDESNISDTNFLSSDLDGASLVGAQAVKAKFCAASLIRANCSNAEFRRTDFSFATLVRTKFSNATLVGCEVYGASVWDVDLEGATQADLVIKHARTRTGRSLGMYDSRPFPSHFTITVDSLKVANFIYLLLSSPEIRDVIDSITSKLVLILGRFTQSRKEVLDALHEQLRRRNYTPVIFDFDGPTSRDLTETISTLAHLSRFVVADLTDARSVPQELMSIVPHLPSVPVLPILHSAEQEYGMFEHLKRFPWVLPILRYEGISDLTSRLEREVIDPIEVKIKEQWGGVEGKRPNPGLNRTDTALSRGPAG